MYEICYTLKFWLDWNASHVAVLYDSHGGTLRAGFVVASFLRYSERHNNIIDAVTEFEEKRMGRGCTWQIPQV